MLGTTVAPEVGRKSVAEYIEIELKTGIKHEFFNGIIVPVAGGTIPHNLISANILRHLGNALEKTGMDATIFGSDQKIYLPKYHYYVYPDAVVVAEEPVLTEEEADAIVNPLLVIEVLSPTTASYDRNRKFVEYRSLPSFKEYALVRQDAPEVVSFVREKEDLWREAEYIGLENDLILKSVDVRLAMAQIYQKVKFPETEKTKL